MGFLKKYGKWTPIIALTWLILHVVVPIALLRIPAFEKYIVAFVEKIPFEIPGIG